MIRTLLWACLLIAGAEPRYQNAGVQRYIKATVDLFNTLYIDSAVFFYTDFGDGVPLLHGEAELQVNSPLQLIASSQIREGNTTQYVAQLKSDYINVLIPPSGVWWILKGCFIQVKYNVLRDDYGVHGVPSSLEVSSCDLLESGHGPTPGNPQEILPVLSKGMFVSASDKLSFDIPYPSIDDRLRSMQMKQLLEYLVYQLAPIH